MGDASFVVGSVTASSARGGMRGWNVGASVRKLEPGELIGDETGVGGVTMGAASEDSCSVSLALTSGASHDGGCSP